MPGYTIIWRLCAWIYGDCVPGYMETVCLDIWRLCAWMYYNMETVCLVYYNMETVCLGIL